MSKRADLELPELPALPAMPALPDLPPLPGILEDEEEGEEDDKPLSEVTEEIRKDLVGKSQVQARKFEDVTDSEYWIAVCFESREQKEQFLKALDLIKLGDKYLNGLLVAEKLGVKLTRVEKPRLRSTASKKLAKLIAR